VEPGVVDFSSKAFFSSGFTYASVGASYAAKSDLGYSQVTAVVESREPVASAKLQYEIRFGARLVPPYYVTLVDPVEVPHDSVGRSRLTHSLKQELPSAPNP